MAQQHSPLRTALMVGTVAILGLGAIGIVGTAQARGPFGAMWGHDSGRPMVGYMLDRALESVDATDEQRQDIEEIVVGATADIEPLISDFDDRRERFTTLVSAQTLDRAAFEAQRLEMLDTLDAVSARALEALLDAAEVLTPEQRASLAERHEGFGHRFGPGVGPGRH